MQHVCVSDGLLIRLLGSGKLSYAPTMSDGNLQLNMETGRLRTRRKQIGVNRSLPQPRILDPVIAQVVHRHR